jgi:uncharacterized lipoprotein YmbA
VKRLALALAGVALTLAGCGPATITTPDGWVLPDLPHETKCWQDQGSTLCVDRVTGERYLNGERVYR